MVYITVSHCSTINNMYCFVIR